MFPHHHHAAGVTHTHVDYAHTACMPRPQAQRSMAPRENPNQTHALHLTLHQDINQRLEAGQAAVIHDLDRLGVPRVAAAHLQRPPSTVNSVTAGDPTPR